ncbi:hypothetical protein, partial [Chitinivorax tropicus]|uniref:hypothetical protein n=1 Tax=Chitinivorax tropicus TaxID=714531 RepID=UPI001C84F326
EYFISLINQTSVRQPIHKHPRLSTVFFVKDHSVTAAKLSSVPLCRCERGRTILTHPLAVNYSLQIFERKFITRCFYTIENSYASPRHSTPGTVFFVARMNPQSTFEQPHQSKAAAEAYSGDRISVALHNQNSLQRTTPWPLAKHSGHRHPSRLSNPISSASSNMSTSHAH